MEESHIQPSVSSKARSDDCLGQNDYDYAIDGDVLNGGVVLAGVWLGVI
jgi:hypothetical protein